MTRPTVTNSIARELLAKARDVFVVHGRPLCQRSVARTKSGDPTYVDADNLYSMSLTGALIWAAKQVGTPWMDLDKEFAKGAQLPAQVAVCALHDALQAMNATKDRDPYHAIANWCDANGREARHVVNLLGLVLGLRLEVDPDLKHPGQAEKAHQGLALAAIQPEPPAKATPVVDPWTDPASPQAIARELELPDPWGLSGGIEDDLPPPPDDDPWPPEAMGEPYARNASTETDETKDALAGLQTAAATVTVYSRTLAQFSEPSRETVPDFPMPLELSQDMETLDLPPPPDDLPPMLEDL